jgi:hypothetical protein
MQCIRGKYGEVDDAPTPSEKRPGVESNAIRCAPPKITGASRPSHRSAKRAREATVSMMCMSIGGQSVLCSITHRRQTMVSSHTR